MSFVVSIIIGLTGNIACGKSTVGQIFKKFSIKVLDSDEVVHRLYSEDLQVQQALTKNFGTHDRSEIAKMVFSSGDKAKNLKRDLESILHPKVDTVFREWVKSNQAETFLVNLVPLLFEAKLEQRYDYIITVFTSEEKQIERLKLRDASFSDEDIMQRIKSQMSQQQKLKKSDFTIDNTGHLEDLEIQVEEIIEQLCKKEAVEFDFDLRKAL